MISTRPRHRRDAALTRQGGAPFSHLKRGLLASAVIFASAGAAPAFASPMAQVNPDALDAPEADVAIKGQQTDFFSGIWTRSTLLGDMGGLRSFLGRAGITLDINETSELFGNLSGGIDKGHAYDGLTVATIQMDTKQAFGWEGGLFNVSGEQIHGTNLSTRYLGTLNTASGIEATPETRLWELWYQQSFFNKKFDIKIGQQSLDQEFMVSTYGLTFVNTMFGWPGVPSYDLPSGGPAYPLSGLGVRVRGQIAPGLTGLFGVFAGDPSGNRDDNHGTNFSLNGSTLFIGELQYGINQPVEGDMDLGGNNNALPGMYKLGAWYHNGSFADQRFDSNGVPLVSPDSNGIGAQHHGNYSIYAVADQMIWRPDPAEPKSLGVFARVMYAPTDQNLVRASANLGLSLKAPFSGRDNDVAGIAVTYIKVSDQARQSDQDFIDENPGMFALLRSSETVIEATYQYQVAPWWILQADAQYVFNPGGGIVNPNDPTQKIKNEFVLGLRTNITF
ncbi:porin [Pararobbsia alpina]|uniref:carbohydrate porin n=1 Tax=Pararobbsia alpina TaxID=621374 RepID=UPI0039A4CE8A